MSRIASPSYLSNGRALGIECPRGRRPNGHPSIHLSRRHPSAAAACFRLEPSSPAHGQRAARGSRGGTGSRSLHPDRRPAVHQLHRDAHHQRRLADAAGGDRRHGAGGALPREPGRADGEGGRPPGRAAPGGVGHRDRRHRGRPHACHRGLSGRHRSRRRCSGCRISMA